MQYFIEDKLVREDNLGMTKSIFRNIIFMNKYVADAISFDSIVDVANSPYEFRDQMEISL